MEKEYLKFKKINESETELYVYGDIREKDFWDILFGMDDGFVNVKSIQEAFEKIDTPNLIVRINSYGGSVDQGLTIYGLLSSLRERGIQVKTIVDGFACSAASVIFMAGEERIVPENGLLLIHNVWSQVQGDSNAMKKAAEDLEKITQPSLEIYAKKTKLSKDKLKEMMDREQWIDSDEAYEWGFSTTKTRNEAKQALEANYVHKLVMQNKELNARIELLEKNQKVTAKNSWENFFSNNK